MSDEVIRDGSELAARCPRRGTDVDQASAGGPRVDLTDCAVTEQDLSGRSLESMEASGVTFRQVALEGSRLSGRLRRVQFSQCGLRGADADGAQLHGCSFFASQLIETTLRGASLRGTQFSGCAMSNADLSGATLVDCSLRDAEGFGLKLSGALLLKSRFEGMESSQVSLDRADLTDATLIDCDLRGANLYGACFDGALLIRVDLRQANLTSASFRGARLVGVRLDTSQLEPGLVREIEEAMVDDPAITPLASADPSAARVPWSPRMIDAILAAYVLEGGGTSTDAEDLASLLAQWKARGDVQGMASLRVRGDRVEALVGGSWCPLDTSSPTAEAGQPTPEPHEDREPADPAPRSDAAPEADQDAAPSPTEQDEVASPLDTSTFRRLKHLEID